MYQPGRNGNDIRIRIFFVFNGESKDVCGAINEAVAWATCDILNRMRGYPKKV